MDLSSIGRMIKKGDVSLSAPLVAGIVVLKHEKDETAQAVQKAIADAGYKVDTVVKNDDGKTVMYAQIDKPLEGNPTCVRLSESMAVVMHHFPTSVTKADASFSGKIAKQDDFVPGFDMAFDAMYDAVSAVVIKADASSDVPATVKKMAESFGSYLATLTKAVPVAVIKADLAVQEIVRKDAKIIPITDLMTTTPTTGGETATRPGFDAPTAWLSMSRGQQLAWQSWYDSNFANGASEGKVVGKADEPKADDKPAPTATTDTKVTETPAGKTTDTHKETPAPVETKKSDDPVLGALAELTGLVKGLVVKTDKLEKDQAALAETTAEAVQKSEKVLGTVTAPARAEEEPAQSLVVAKGDTDPRSGNFDTARMPSTRRKGLLAVPG